MNETTSYTEWIQSHCLVCGQPYVTGTPVDVDTLEVQDNVERCAVCGNTLTPEQVAELTSDGYDRMVGLL